jgi:hypothetical protein
MSVPFSTTSSDTPSRGYLRALALSVAIWLGLFLIFTWTVDPYGVSPMQLAMRGINTQKPKRVDIDRLVCRQNISDDLRLSLREYLAHRV